MVLVAKSPCSVEKLLALIYYWTGLVTCWLFVLIPVFIPKPNPKFAGWLMVWMFDCWLVWVFCGLEVLNDTWLPLLAEIWFVVNMYCIVLKSPAEGWVTLEATGSIFTVWVLMPEKKSICSGGFGFYSYTLLKKSTSLLSITTDGLLCWLTGLTFIVWNIICIVLNSSWPLVVCWGWVGALCSYY